MDHLNIVTCACGFLGVRVHAVYMTVIIAVVASIQAGLEVHEHRCTPKQSLGYKLPAVHASLQPIATAGIPYGQPALALVLKLRSAVVSLKLLNRGVHAFGKPAYMFAEIIALHGHILHTAAGLHWRAAGQNPRLVWLITGIRLSYAAGHCAEARSSWMTWIRVDIAQRMLRATCAHFAHRGWRILGLCCLRRRVLDARTRCEVQPAHNRYVDILGNTR